MGGTATCLRALPGIQPERYITSALVPIGLSVSPIARSVTKLSEILSGLGTFLHFAVICLRCIYPSLPQLSQQKKVSASALRLTGCLRLFTKKLLAHSCNKSPLPLLGSDGDQNAMGTRTRGNTGQACGFCPGPKRIPSPFKHRNDHQELCSRFLPVSATNPPGAARRCGNALCRSHIEKVTGPFLSLTCSSVLVVGCVIAGEAQPGPRQVSEHHAPVIQRGESLALAVWTIFVSQAWSPCFLNDRVGLRSDIR